jgi:hypothetical protein
MDCTKIPSIVYDVLNSSGQPLDAATRMFMESRFGQDFSQVRVHADGKAAESALSVRALAYAAGSHVVFGTGHYAPEAAEGRRLIAHELVHTIQQGMAAPGRAPALADQPALEQEADDIAGAVAVGAGQRPALRVDVGILRDEKSPPPPPAGPYAGAQPWPPPSPPPPLDPHTAYEAKLRDAVGLLRDAGFGRAEYRKEHFDKDLWEKVEDPAGAPSRRPPKMLRLKRGIVPSVAITRMFANLGAWSVDCAQFVQVAEWYAMLYAYGAREFDRKMQGLEFRLRPHGSTGVRQKRLYKRNAPDHIMTLERPGETDEPELTPVEDVLKAAPIGSRVQWTNRDPAVRDTTWQHENTIKLGADLFAAHGFRGRGKRNTWSATDVQQELADTAVGTAPESYVKANVFLAQIEIYETP